MTNEERCSRRIENEVVNVVREEVFGKIPKWLQGRFFVSNNVRKFCDIIVSISEEYVKATINDYMVKNKDI